MEKQSTYHFRPSWWFVFVFLGSLFVLGAVYIFLETRRQSLIDIIMVYLIASFMFVLGAFCLVIPITSKVILTSEGIQYCTIGGIVKARWSDVTVRIFKDQTGENVALHVSNYEIIPRAWTRYAPWDAQKGATYNLKHHGIPISQFGGFSPHKLVADIRSFVPDL
jgi:hypothetical protein